MTVKAFQWRGVGHSRITDTPRKPMRNWPIAIPTGGVPGNPAARRPPPPRAPGRPRPPPPAIPPALPGRHYKSVAAPRAFKLTELNAKLMASNWITSTEQNEKGEYVFRGEDGQTWGWSESPKWHQMRPTEILAEADGIWFDCPLCHATGEHHSVSVGFAGRAPPGTFSRDSNGKDSRWQIVGGTGLHDLQLSPSIWLKSERGCGWHGFVGFAGVPAGEAR